MRTANPPARVTVPRSGGCGPIAFALAGAILALASCGSKFGQTGTPKDGGADGPLVCTGCGANQVCVSGKCTDVPAQCPCPKETYCDLGMSRCVIGCTSDDLCDTGRICLTDQRMCVAGCRGDTGCSAGQICDQMMCHAGCRDDSGCAAGQICEQSLCRAGCRGDTGCSTGQICDQTMCHAGCRDDSGCAAGQICEQSLCRAGCRMDADCGSGKICEAATLVCVAGCRATAGCPLEQVCNTTTSTCVPGCDGDARCNAGHICESGQCITGCRTDATCPTGQRCFSQICRAYCLVDSDCPLEHVCVGNECIDGCGKPGGWISNEDYKRCPSGKACHWTGCQSNGTTGSCASASCTADCSGLSIQWPDKITQDQSTTCNSTDPTTSTYICYGAMGETQRCTEICNGGLAKPCKQTPGQICANYVTNMSKEPPNSNSPWLCHSPCQSDDDCKMLYDMSGVWRDCLCQPAGSKYPGLCGRVASATTDLDLCRYTTPPM